MLKIRNMVSISLAAFCFIAVGSAAFVVHSCFINRNYLKEINHEGKKIINETQTLKAEVKT